MNEHQLDEFRELKYQSLIKLQEAQDLIRRIHPFVSGFHTEILNHLIEKLDQVQEDVLSI